MNKEKMMAWLGRPLTTSENENFDVLSESVLDVLSELLGSDVRAVSEKRKFEMREGYRTLSVGLFRKIKNVKINGGYVDGYHGSLINSSWNRSNVANCLIFNVAKFGGKAEVEADWGFEEIPSDLGRLCGELFAELAKPYTAGMDSVSSKRVEDFSINYNTNENTKTPFEAICERYKAVLYKYKTARLIDTKSSVRR